MLSSKKMFGTIAVLALGTMLTLGSAASFAGKVGGPTMIQGFATPDDYDTYSLRFEGGRIAHVIVKGNHLADLDIKVIDPVTLRVIAQDLRPAADGRVTFLPNRTREYIVLIHNFSRDRGTRYTLHTN